jgi:hypothetical protein
VAEDSTNGGNDTPYRNRVSPEAAARARAAFQAALAASMPPYELGQLNLFEEEEERFIRHEVERKLYTPVLPNGGDKERRVIDRLEKLKDEKDWAGSGHAFRAIAAWKKTVADNPRHAGCYYHRKPLAWKDNKDEIELLRMLRDSAAQARQWEKKWFAQLMLDGAPETVSNFDMECLFLLRKPDGSVDRLVRLRNILGEVSRGQHHGESDVLDPKAFASPEKFREWCLARGNFSWHGNQNHLQMLHLDLTHFAAWRVINQVNTVGWFPIKKEKGKIKNGEKKTATPSVLQDGIWFCDDCAYADGQCLRPDEEGIYWWDGQGYYLNRKGREANFAQGRPKMNPGVSIGEALKKKTDVSDGTDNERVAPKVAPNEMQLLREFFREVCGNFYATLGSYEGFLLIGSMLSYAVAPEIFSRRREFPGLFTHGQMSSGKTVATEWGIRFWGYEKADGIGLLKGTAVGLLQQAENYSNQPLWVDEFRADRIGEDKEAIIRDAFNRLPAVKYSPDGVQREMRTSFIVSGESTSGDAAFISRFPHIQVSKAKRLGTEEEQRERYEWMQANKKHFYLFTRLVLERREQFAGTMLRLLDEWMNSAEFAGMSERVQFVHGVPWAAWQAMDEMLEAYPVDASTKFLKFMINHAKGSAIDVTSETNINLFWSDLLTAVKADAIPASCFNVEWTYTDHPPGWPNQTLTPSDTNRAGWMNCKVFIDPDPTISAMQIYLKKEGSQIPLQKKDLRSQLSKTPYWMEGKFTKSFGPTGGKMASKCWGFDLDHHPMGRQDVSDADYERMIKEHAMDMRLGPLYALAFWWTNLDDAKK